MKARLPTLLLRRQTTVCAAKATVSTIRDSQLGLGNLLIPLVTWLSHSHASPHHGCYFARPSLKLWEYNLRLGLDLSLVAPFVFAPTCRGCHTILMLPVIDVATIQTDCRLRMERKSEIIQEDWTMDEEDIFCLVRGRIAFPGPILSGKAWLNFLPGVTLII